jgi:tRNA dimethylallyltransferase
VLTARPSPDEEARAPHALFGHLPYDALYSTGAWLREAAPCLDGPERPIFVGGTGLYFAALTEGLSDIPATPPAIRAEGDTLPLNALRAALDPDTAARIDLANRARVQRAWEVLQATGRGLAAWQADTPPPLLPLDTAQAFVMNAPKDWLTPRIETRFDKMLAGGALDEVRAMLDRFDPALPACRAIGAPDLIAYLRGETDLDTARETATIATRQYAKRQRTWFRKRCRDWTWIDGADV